MENIHEHPVIKNLLIYGNPDGEEERNPTCPICMREAETFYLDYFDDVVGCENCIQEVDSPKWRIGARE